MDYISFQQQHHLILLYVAIFLLLVANLAPKSSIVFFKNNQRKDSIQVALWQPVITDNKPCSTVINGAAFTLPCSEIETDEVFHEVPFHFAACLISMDDNKILPEWLAYHYEVLPLRRLIYARDPYSVTSSKPILDAYEEHLGMNITIWNEEDYHYAGNGSNEIMISHANATSEERSHAYAWRQRVFYTQCAEQLKKEGYTWTAFTDTDEYISFNFYKEPANYTLNQEGVKCRRVRVWGASCRTDGSPINMMKRFGLQFPPNLGGPNATIAHFIHTYWTKAVTALREVSSMCDILPRVAVAGGNVDEGQNSSTATTAVTSPEFNESIFRTLQYRQILRRDKPLPGKSIMNVQEWTPDRKQPLHMHLGARQCFNGKRRNQPDASMAFFRIHHYTGTLEEFMSRPGDQYRRSVESYLERNRYNVSGTVLDEVVGWLDSFVQRVGQKRAHYLTEGLRKWAFATDALVSGT